MEDACNLKKGKEISTLVDVNKLFEDKLFRLVEIMELSGRMVDAFNGKYPPYDGMVKSEKEDDLEVEIPIIDRLKTTANRMDDPMSIIQQRINEIINKIG